MTKCNLTIFILAFQHVDATRAIICGDNLDSFIIRKLVVDDTMVGNTLTHNSHQKWETSARIMIELLDKKQFSTPMPLPGRVFYSENLVYDYPKQGPISQEIIRESLAVLGTSPIAPQPSLLDPPASLMPLKLDPQEIIPKIVEEIKKIAQKLASNPA